MAINARAIDSRIPLASRNVGGLGAALEAGRQDKRRNELHDLAVSGEEQRQGLIEENRDVARAESQRRAAEEARLANLDSIVQGALEVEPLLGSLETLPMAAKRLEARIQEIEARNGDASDTREVLEHIQAGRIDQARAGVASAIQVAERMGRIKSASREPAGASPKVLSAGQVLIDADGNQIAAGPDKAPPLRRIARDVNGVDRYVDTGEAVFPGVEELPDPDQVASDKAKKQDKELLGGLAQDLLENFDNTKRAFGILQGRLPTTRADTADVEASLDQLIGLLSLENRAKMKGTGQISDFESKLLGNAGTVLGNRLISDERAKQELERIQRVFGGEIVEAPPEALAMLRSNPEFADQFESKYGYLPEGF